MTVSRETVMSWLSQIKDPEIPVINIVDMGIIRQINYLGDCLELAITPTYSGCPAIAQIEKNIGQLLTQKGVTEYQIHTIHSPPWSSDQMTDEGKRKLREYGISPPKPSCDITGSTHKRALRDGVECPLCGSTDTALRSEFGSTACKSLNYCRQCQNHFENFKCV